jgi:hypothetical protein
MHDIAVYFDMKLVHKESMCPSNTVSSVERATMALGHMLFCVVVGLADGGVPTVANHVTI